MQADICKPAKNEKTPRRKRPTDQLSGAMDLFASPQRPKADEVTGISRSGRVRKKSSKLVDFESPDDLADKHKRQRQQIQAQRSIDRFDSPPASASLVSTPPARIAVVADGANAVATANRNRKNLQSFQPRSLAMKVEPAPGVSDTEPQFTDSESDERVGINDDERFSSESGSNDDDDDDDDDNVVDPLMIDEKETGFRKLEPPEQETPSQANSLYMLEKCKKKLIIKDGKIIGRMKAQRKDKGKTRFTAYMLWAKQIRQELIEQCPYMDFAAISKRLGELWATVPNLEKYNWRRRAKRLAAKPSVQPTPKDEAVWKTPSSTKKKNFINKIGNGKEQKASPTKKTIHLGVPSVIGNVPISPPSNNRLGKDLLNEPIIGTGMYKVVGTEPVDVAAHLKLLGESLTIIGERLKEHEGQIAVSGSVSVLLDSLLCALGPLVCLTQQITETNGANPDTLSRLLDNIAYIMPGL